MSGELGAVPRVGAFRLPLDELFRLRLSAIAVNDTAAGGGRATHNPR